MKLRLTLCTAALIFATAAFASTQNIHVSDHGVATCADVRVSYDDGPAVTAEETLTIPGSIALNINPGQNGGVYVTGYDGSQFQVTACKAAPTSADLQNMRAQFAGDQLTATGADQSSSIVYFIVKAPRSASISISTHNGPASISDLSGAVHVNTTNGPIKIRSTSGDVDARAQNGPIDFTGDTGKVQLHATNGPVKLALSGSHWNGAGVEASTVNGPVALYVATGYNAGVVIRTDGHSPMSCEANLCRNARDFHENAREIEVGTGATVINLSTHNGPVKIATSREVL